MSLNNLSLAINSFAILASIYLIGRGLWTGIYDRKRYPSRFASPIVAVFLVSLGLFGLWLGLTSLLADF